MLQKVQKYLKNLAIKILQCEHCRIFKVCLVIFNNMNEMVITERKPFLFENLHNFYDDQMDVFYSCSYLPKPHQFVSKLIF